MVGRPDRSVGARPDGGRRLLRLAVLALVAVSLVAANPAGVRAQSRALAHNMVDLGAAAPGERVVSLTFDDGPHPTYTPQILDVLARHGVKATFFVNGRNAERYPHLIDRIKAEGHVIANHGWDHSNLTKLSAAAISDQIGGTQSVLGRRGVASRCLRPPYGATNSSVQQQAAAHGLRTINWSVDPFDFRRPGAGAIADRVTSRLRPGAVVLLHDGGGNRDQTVAALDTIIARTHAVGYRFGTICK